MYHEIFVLCAYFTFDSILIELKNLNENFFYLKFFPFNQSKQKLFSKIKH